MPQPTPMIPLCRLYENESKKTGTPYLVGNLTYTAKIVGFKSKDEHGNECWQLFVEERPPRNPAPAESGTRPAAQIGGIEAGDLFRPTPPKPQPPRAGRP
jgi:hypothetical protein